jgi:hypothetical protein
MYSLLSCFVLLMVWAALKENWIGFTLSAIGVIYTQNLGVFYVASAGLTILLLRARVWRSAIRPLLALLTIVAAWLPLAAMVFSQARAMGGGFWLWPLTPGGVLIPFVSMIVGWRMPAWAIINMYGATFAMSISALIVCRRWLFKGRNIIIIGVMLGTPALIAILSVVWRSVYLPRALLPTSFLMMLFWAYTLANVPQPHRRLAQIVIGSALVLGVICHYFPQAQRNTMLNVVDLVDSQWRQGDVLLHSTLDTAITTSYYFQGKPYFIRRYASDLNQSLSETTKGFMGFQQATLPEILDAGYSRVWIVAYPNPLSNSSELNFLDDIQAMPNTQVVLRKEYPHSEQIVYLITLR